MSEITVYINGEMRQLPAVTVLADLISQLQQETQQESDPTRIATAVNEVFVPRAARRTYILQDQDQIFIFTPITGG